MDRLSVFRVVVIFALLLAVGSLAHAQATRTWVSGVGDDANPCSRTAPCKTFAGAISKTAAAGEINVLDPGGFGGVTITKSISIIADGVEAGVLVSGTNAIIINAGVNDFVVLRGLDIEGLGTGLTGIRFLAGAALHVENCTINNFNGSGAGIGIDFAPSGAAQLYVTDTIIRNARTATTGGGIHIRPAVTGSATAVLDNVRVERSLFGVRAQGASKVSINHSVFYGNTNNGVIGVSSVQINIDNSVISNNGVAAGFGVQSSGAGAVVRIGNSQVTNNGTGLGFNGGGALLSYSNNHVAGNTVDGAPSGTITPL
jgi:hypothetical protein